MTLLILGLLLWWAAHLFPIAAKPRRDALAAKIGEGPYKGAFALLTLGTVALMVIGYQSADYIHVWSPPPFLNHLNNLLMVLAVALFIAKDIPSIVRRKLRHPQLAGVKVWALAHLLVNGDVASIVLFGGLLLWAVAAMIGSNKRDGKGEITRTATTVGLAIHVVATLVVFGVIAMIHNWAGVSPFPG